MVKLYGGSAFPVFGGDGSRLFEEPGMTLRDWFAGMALAALADSEFKPKTTNEAASFCYRIADAMLAERDKE